MPMEVVFHDDGGASIVGNGIVNGQEIYDAAEDVYVSENSTTPVKYLIGDFSQVETFDLNQSDVRRLAAHDAAAIRENPALLIAVIGASDVGFGLSRMWNATMENSVSNASVFRNMDEARTWIAQHLDDA